MRIGIVGAGVSGLVAAYLLHRRHEITVFEANAYVGGHINTIDVSSGGDSLAVDTGFIVYNEQNYPAFTRLLAQLPVQTQSSSMSFSVRADGAGLEYNGSTVRQLFAQRRNLLRPSFHRMIADIFRFNRHAPFAVRNGAAHLSLGEYLAEGRYSRSFIDHYLVPMGSALWSVPRAHVLEMPARFFVLFFENHGMLTVGKRPEWRVVTGGSSRYVEALIRGFRDRIRLRHPVQNVTRTAGGVMVDGEVFDHVIFACHSDQALGMLADASCLEREILGAFPYQKNEVVLHTDTSVLPTRRAAWAAWNYRLQGAPDDTVVMTYNMNVLQALDAAETYCVTLNDDTGIDPDRILYRTEYQHPVFTARGAATHQRHGEISGKDRTHYCGAYWGYGFHEDGVQSALAVCSYFGAAL